MSKLDEYKKKHAEFHGCTELKRYKNALVDMCILIDRVEELTANVSYPRVSDAEKRFVYNGYIAEDLWEMIGNYFKDEMINKYGVNK